MADFSKYGAPSPEWEHLTSTMPIPPPNFDIDPEELQQITNAGREAVSAQQLKASGLGDKVSWQDHTIPGRDQHDIPIRIYRPRNAQEGTRLPVYLFFHGGGYIFGTLSSEDAACCRIAAALPIIVVNVCYRHTPQHRYPRAHDDAWDVFKWILENDIGGDLSQLLVGGISAGGGLTASVVLRELAMSKQRGGKSRIRGQILCIPWLIYSNNYPFGLLASKEASSYHQCADAPILPRPQIDRFTSLLAATNPDGPYLSVGNAKDEEVVGMPRTAFLVAGMDPLRDEGLLYAEKLERGGVPTKVHVFPGLPHGFRRFNDLPSSRRWDEVIVENIKWALGDASQSGTRIHVETAPFIPLSVKETANGTL